MTEITRPLSTLEAVKLVQALKNKMKEADDSRIFKHGRAEYISINHLKLYEWMQSLEKLEKYLQWGI